MGFVDVKITGVVSFYTLLGNSELQIGANTFSAKPYFTR